MIKKNIWLIVEIAPEQNNYEFVHHYDTEHFD